MTLEIFRGLVVSFSLVNKKFPRFIDLTEGSNRLKALTLTQGKSFSSHTENVQPE